jgi:hypothetical protein
MIRTTLLPAVSGLVLAALTIAAANSWAGAGDSSESKKRRLSRLELGAARMNGGFDGPDFGSIGAWGAVLGSVGDVHSLGVEAGYYALGRYAGDQGCLDPSCSTRGYSNYYDVNVLHVGLLYDRGPLRGARGLSVLAGAGYYSHSTRYEDADARYRDIDAHGAGVTFGLGFPVVRLSPQTLLGVSLRYHGFIGLTDDGGGGVGSGSFLALTAGIRSS